MGEVTVHCRRERALKSVISGKPARHARLFPLLQRFATRSCRGSLQVEVGQYGVQNEVQVYLQGRGGPVRLGTQSTPYDRDHRKSCVDVTVVEFLLSGQADPFSTPPALPATRISSFRRRMSSYTFSEPSIELYVS